MEASRAVINTGRVSATGKTGGRIRVATRNGIDAGEWDASGEGTGGDIHIRASGNWEQTAAGRMDASAAAGDGGAIRVTAEKGLWLSGTLDCVQTYELRREEGQKNRKDLLKCAQIRSLVRITH